MPCQSPLLATTLTLLVAAAASKAQVIQRPIKDFVSRQGTTKQYFPPVSDYLGWTEPNKKCATGASRFALIDYAGLADKWLREESKHKMSLGTRTDGVIYEQRLNDGSSLVTVLVITHNALTWVLDICADFPGPHLFGHKAPEVLKGAKPSLGTCYFLVTYWSPKFRDPIPDLVVMFNEQNQPQKPISVYLWTEAHGSLRPAFNVPDLTPGICIVGQVGLYWLQGDDKYPVEFVHLAKTGRK